MPSIQLSTPWKIVLGSVLISCILGLAVDLVTAHVAVDYFAVHHPKVLSTSAPLPLALYWGIAASWWFGLIAGALQAWMNSRQKSPLPPKRILRMMAKACIFIWLAMMAVLVGIYLFAGIIPIEKRRPTFEYDRRMVAVAMAHQFEYAYGAIAVVVLIFRIRKVAREEVLDSIEPKNKEI